VTDIAAGARHAPNNDWLPAVRRPRAGSARGTIGWHIARRFLVACSAVMAPRRRPVERQYHRRESFVEDAAMSREMFKL
jgi:hypothetical protein